MKRKANQLTICFKLDNQIQNVISADVADEACEMNVMQEGEGAEYVRGEAACDVGWAACEKGEEDVAYGEEGIVCEEGEGTACDEQGAACETVAACEEQHGEACSNW